MPAPIRITIPEPCHSSVSEMTANEKGYYCHSCSKNVIDFTAMTDVQVHEYLSSTKGKICGRFKSFQLDRSIEGKEDPTLLDNIGKAAASVAIATMLAAEMSGQDSIHADTLNILPDTTALIALTDSIEMVDTTSSLAVNDSLSAPGDSTMEVLTVKIMEYEILGGAISIEPVHRIMPEMWGWVIGDFVVEPEPIRGIVDGECGIYRGSVEEPENIKDTLPQAARKFFKRMMMPFLPKGVKSGDQSEKEEQPLAEASPQQPILHEDRRTKVVKG